ncbi:hypothetical protein [Marinilabilia rubra]|uniref:Uncharacterized protein n=1 Tax=Marinilabilia rubra TaxID=2162893 RepID=A0A2U2B953_9BACT|nr:hypothetical protein [Marinilabilia rubra]PWD99595.1 hypothetical protein DDZ16_09090 [Marinilabilia rubra]
MKIVPIFGKNFKAIQYTGEKKDEFHRVFSVWNDPEYLDSFFEKNKMHLSGEFWGNMDVETAITKTLFYVEEFERQFEDLNSKYSRNELVRELDDFFIPLHKIKESGEIISQHKAFFNWLRLYALKLDGDVFIVTGGAIKLTKAMQDSKHTNMELRKIKSCRDYLITQGIITADTIVEEVEF